MPFGADARIAFDRAEANRDDLVVERAGEEGTPALAAVGLRIATSGSQARISSTPLWNSRSAVAIWALAEAELPLRLWQRWQWQ